MRLASVLATAAIVVSCGAGIAQAQIKKAVPAEFPPASYNGRQYVDSSGCVFIRAGVDGAVNWVPRVTRGRKQICGMQPTMSGSQIAAARAPRATGPVTQPAPAPAATTVARKPAPAPATTTVYRSAPPPKPAATAPDTVPATATVAKPAPAAKPRRVAVADCANLSPQSRQYINSTNRYTIRCGSQSAPHVTERATAGPNATIYNPGAPAGNVSAAYRTGSYATAPGYATAATRVAPKHVYANQKASTEGVHVPEGYVAVWEDDRLNTRRAHQTFAGKAQMEQRWTKTTPRRLKQPAVGPVVTEADVVSRSAVAYPMAMSFAQRAAPQTAAKPAAKMAATPEVKSRAASHRYVELGNFSDPAHAKRTAQKLANSGLPARMGKVTHKGKTYTLVMAGPFKTQSQLDSGLARVRGMGFAQASLRR